MSFSVLLDTIKNCLRWLFAYLQFDWLGVSNKALRKQWKRKSAIYHQNYVSSHLEIIVSYHYGQLQQLADGCQCQICPDDSTGVNSLLDEHVEHNTYNKLRNVEMKY